MRVAELPGLPGLGLRLLAAGRLDRPLRRVYTTDLPDPGRYLSGGELVLTGLIWCREPGDADRFTAALARAGAAALAAGEALGPVPAELVRACTRHGLPLLAVPAETSFGTVTDEVMRRLSADRAGAASRALGRHRRMLSAVSTGAGLGALFEMAAPDLPAGCWLITAAGRPAAGTGGQMPAALAVRLAREYLTAPGLPATARVRGQDYTLLAAGGPPGPTGWFLACAGIAGGAADAIPEPAAELAADIAVERARLDAGRRAGRRLGQQIVTALVTGADPAEAATLMRAAELPVQAETEAGAGYLAVALRDEPPGSLAGQAADLADELVRPATGRLVLGLDAGEVVVLAPLAGELGTVAAGAAARTLAGRIRDAGPALAAGLRGGTLTVGISDPVTGAGGLAGAVREARGARRLAGLRPGPVAVATGDEGSTHAMLLASVPAGVLGSFRDRLLGPLRRYDRRRGTQLVPTLAAFLACSGSWHSCAARLHVHVNTLRYRIRRIEELTGRDLSSLGDQVDFFLALSAAGPPLTGPSDAGPSDAGPSDAGPPDAGPPDAGQLDPGQPGTGRP
jgi:Purine catabolism regulatory protein-like family/PucR C-terminal helix-turn-helix domain